MDPLELGTIAAILLVLFLWGPQKIPELARMIGQARREFDNATREFQKVSTSIQNGTSEFLAPPPSRPAPQQRVASVSSATAATATTTAAPTLPAPSRSPPQSTVTRPSLPQSSSAKTGDQLLIEAARKLGIPTTGKTREQIQEEIIAMAQRSSSSSSSSERSPRSPPTDPADSTAGESG